MNEAFKKITIKMHKKRRLIRVTITLVVVLIFIGTIDNSFAVTTPSLVTKMGSAFKSIKEYLVKLAGPIAAVAIVTGIIIRKLSFGDEEKMVIGKRVIVNAIGGYFVILLVDLIIKFVEALV